MDFDDLLLNLLNLLKNNLTFKQQLQGKIRHILIDEYQDTNKLQHEIIKEFALDNTLNKLNLKSLCAVGDEDQSIYSWRGALATNMLKFEEDFQPIQKIKIEQNYRSANSILEVANKLIANNVNRFAKKLWSNKKGKNRIIEIKNKSDWQEADLIIKIVSLHKQFKKQLKNMAVLYRSHFQSRIIEEALIRNQIPYQIIGGIRFYERKEIKDILAYLRLYSNPYDKISFSRILNCPPRNLGEKIENFILEKWEHSYTVDIFTLLKSSLSEFTPAKKEKIKKFLEIFDLEDNKLQKISDLTKHFIEKTEYISYLHKLYDVEEVENRLENLNELCKAMDLFEAKQISTQTGEIFPFAMENTNKLQLFLQEITLMQEKIATNINQNEILQLMTLHAAKGLEFETIVIVGVEEEILPSAKSIQSQEKLEEERRLLYVGITRAKERIILSHSHCRNNFGQLQLQTHSRFLDELDLSSKLKIDATILPSYKIDEILTEWFNDKLYIKIKPQYKHKDLIPTSTIPFPQKSKNKKWKINQIVKHQKFGTGIIKKVEPATATDQYLTIIFKSGTKKILSSFIK